MKKKFSIQKLREKLGESVQRNLSDGLLLSGGLDSTILAYLTPDVKAFTVDFESSGSDLRYAQKAAKDLGMKHYCGYLSADEAIAAIPTVIKVLRTFDPAIPNDVATYFGLKLAKERGCKSVMTGDGGDELFAGYDYMLNLDLGDYIPKIVKSMHFSSNELGEFIGIDIKQPYLDRKFVEFAVKIDPELKIRTIDGKKWGKWILRKTFEDVLPNEIIWREKVPLESGSGTTKLRTILGSKVSDKEFKEKEEEYAIKFRSKEHLFYYETYRKVVGEIPSPKKGEKRCNYCGAGVPAQSNHCGVCGGFPV